MFFFEKKLLKKELADTKQKLTDTKQQLEVLQQQHHDTLVALKSKLQQVSEDCAKLKHHLLLSTDHVCVRQGLKKTLEELAKHYGRSKVERYADGYVILGDTHEVDTHTTSAKNARDAFVQRTLEQINEFASLPEKTAYCRLLLTRYETEHEESWNKSGGWNYETLYLAFQLWLHFKENDTDLHRVFDTLLKNQIGEPDNNGLIKESKANKGSGNDINEEHNDKLLFLDIILHCTNIEIQTLALYRIMDHCQDYYAWYSGWRSSEDTLDLYETPGDYLIAEMISQDFPNRPKLLAQAVERICLREKYDRREREVELMCLLREAALANVAYPYTVQTMFEQILAIGRISAAVLLLKWFCDDDNLLSKFHVQILWLIKTAQKVINDKQKPFNAIKLLYVRCYTRCDVIDLWSLHNRINDADVQSGLKGLAESLDKLWQEFIVDYRFDQRMHKLDYDYSIESRCTDTEPARSLTVHHPYSLFEFDRKVYEAASQKGDKTALKLLSQLNLGSDRSVRTWEEYLKSSGEDEQKLKVYYDEILTMETEQRTQAIKTLETLATMGDVESMVLLARSLEKKNSESEEAFQWLKKAAEKGHVSSMNELGLELSFYQSKREKNYSEAAVWLHKATQCGVPFMAATELGNLYMSGNGVFQDIEKAKECYLMAAKVGDTMGFWYLGRLYARSKLVEPDHELAADWYLCGLRLGANYATDFDEDSGTLPKELITMIYRRWNEFEHQWWNFKSPLSIECGKGRRLE